MTTSTATAEELRGWFAGRIPDGWFTAAPDVQVDDEEILVVGTLSPPEHPAGADDGATEAARLGRITRFREDTRDARIAVALEAEQRFGRKVSWGAEVDGTRRLFTHAAVPVMTRLRMPERNVLDTLIEAGVARSRSEAMAWCVRLVGEHEADWLKDLKDALVHVQKVRAKGPGPSKAGPRASRTGAESI